MTHDTTCIKISSLKYLIRYICEVILPHVLSTINFTMATEIVDMVSEKI